jgi:glycosyltransferase involved in cell wall biosynthesis
VTTSPGETTTSLFRTLIGRARALWLRGLGAGADWFLEQSIQLGRAMTKIRLVRQKPRSLWGATPILTLPLKARADRLLGLRSETLVFTTYYITQDFDWNLRRVVGAVRRFVPGLVPVLDRLILAWVLFRYDVVHLFHDRGITTPAGRFGIPYWEIDALRRANKAVYLFAYGADVRTRDATLALGRWNFCVECPEPGKYCICTEDEGHRVAISAQRATGCLGMADMVPYVPSARHLDYWPIDTDRLQPAPAHSSGGPLRIVHAPNHTHFKGTRHLLACVEALRAEGREIELVQLQGVPNSAVMKAFAEADIVADQFIGGAYGYSALEAMALGKPVLSYIRDPLAIEAFDECPILNATPTTLHETLAWCCDNRDRLAAIGRQGRAYVERWHAIDAVAERLGRLYENDVRIGHVLRPRIEEQRDEIEARRRQISEEPNWDHPYRISSKATPVGRAGELVSPAPLDVTTAIADISQPAARRWWISRQEVAPRDGWSSYDRAPWKHPWLASDNIARFSRFSRATLDRLAEATDARRRASTRSAFFGNLANNSYMRAAGLIRHGLTIDVHLHPQDTAVMSHPLWEEFDGSIADLGANPWAALAAMPQQHAVVQSPTDPDWSRRILTERSAVPKPSDILSVPEFMPFTPTIRALSSYDAILVCQTFAFGPLSGRPFIVGQSGGDIWFDPSRTDLYGRLAVRALREGYAILVSNPLTLSHARRYGVANCLYLPLCFDEEAYRPGLEPEVRQDWERRTGGTFFVLTSMRLDNAWKGASTAIEGFARFVRNAPGARLVMLGWGTDEAATMKALADAGLADKVLLLPTVGKRRLARYLRAADVLMEQFVLGYYGASALEAIASGLPVVMRLERAQYDALVPAGAPPVHDAATPEEVAAQLSRLERDPAARAVSAAAHRDWFLASHAASAAKADYATLLAAAAAGVPIDWTQSPLSPPLDDAETRYHQEQLAAAPPFPQYTI